MLFKAKETLLRMEKLMGIVRFLENMSCSGSAADFSPKALARHVIERPPAYHDDGNILRRRVAAQSKEQIFCISVGHKVVGYDSAGAQLGCNSKSAHGIGRIQHFNT